MEVLWWRRKKKTCSVLTTTSKVSHCSVLVRPFSTSANAAKEEERFLHRRLRGVHVPASRSLCNGSSSSSSSSYDNIDGDDTSSLQESVASCLQSSHRDPVSYACLLRRCGKAVSGLCGMHLHSRIIENSMETSIVLQNCLVQMYAECGFVEESCLVFASIANKDEFSWNFMIRACGLLQYSPRNDDIVPLLSNVQVIPLFERMLGEGILPNKFIFTSILLGCSSPEFLSQGRHMHVRIINGVPLHSDTLLANTLISMYCKCGNLTDAKGLFCRFDERDMVSWNAMVSAHAKCGQGRDALCFYQQMQQEGVMPNVSTFVSLLDACANEAVVSIGRKVHASFAGSSFEFNVVIGTALVNMYGKYGDLENAWRIFNLLPHRNTVSWNGMITSYSLHNQPKRALNLFEQMMQEGIMPDKFIFVSILSTHATKEDLADGRRVYGRVTGSRCETDPFVCTAILNMFCKCGSMEDAEEMFGYIVDPDEVLWTAMISGHAQHGAGKKALELFAMMCAHGSPHPSKVTFMSVLSACSGAGLVDEGVRHLFSMERDYGIVPSLEHINCVLDMLAKSGRLDEAENLIMNMADEATIVTWTILLNACKKQLDVERGKRVANRMLEMYPDYSSPYVLLSHIYIGSGDNEGGDKMIGIHQ